MTPIPCPRDPARCRLLDRLEAMADAGSGPLVRLQASVQTFTEKARASGEAYCELLEAAGDLRVTLEAFGAFLALGNDTEEGEGGEGAPDASP